LQLFQILCFKVDLFKKVIYDWLKYFEVVFSPAISGVHEKVKKKKEENKEKKEF